MSNSFWSPSPVTFSATVLLAIFDGRERQFHGDRRSAVGTIVCGHGAAELANHVDHQEQPESGARPALGRVIRLTEILQHVRGKAGPQVRYFDPQHVTAPLGVQSDPTGRDL